MPTPQTVVLKNKGKDITVEGKKFFSKNIKRVETYYLVCNKLFYYLKTSLRNVSKSAYPLINVSL